MTHRAPPPSARVAPPLSSRTGRAVRRFLAVMFLGTVALAGLHVFQAAEAHDAAAEAFLTERATAFEAVPVLTEREEAQLRRSLNRVHVAHAQALGTEPVETRLALEQEAIRRALPRIDGSHPYAVAGSARYSIPVLTPDGAAMLDSIGTRFHAALDSAGLPRYRFTVTSALRSAEDQAALRGVNANAARGRSSHEYGTTVDISYRRFAFTGLGALAIPEPALSLPTFLDRLLMERARQRMEQAFDRAAATQAVRLQALLGRTLIALEDEGVLVTLMERRQPVFHTTVARALAE